MTTLMLEKDLRNSEVDSEVRTLARTLTVLSRLGSSRKADVILFLAEAELIKRVEVGEPIITLAGADLTGIYLSGADLNEVDLSGADLSEADLRETDLSKANLFEADLHGARLSGADLTGANLGWATLEGAALSDAYLSDASLQGAEPSFANLSNANLSGADLTDAYLIQANLRGARGLTKEQLALTYMGGATMPDGQKYEDWLESKGSGEDGENGGS